MNNIVDIFRNERNEILFLSKLGEIYIQLCKKSIITLDNDYEIYLICNHFL